MMRSNIAAGNWKMNLNFEEAIDLASKVNMVEIPKDVKVILGVPSVYLNKILSICDQNNSIMVSAQNCHHKASGAYTGEISASMLTSMRIPYVIIGHSERRMLFNENDEILLEKLKTALSNDLQIIYCCGEPLEIRKNNEHIEFVISQLKNTLFKLEPESLNNIILAYEPIWAIGTGETATADQAQEMHKSIRESIANHFSNDIADRISILYGGSVKPSNAQELFSKEDVDGGLVGGASLNADDFAAIINAF